MADQEYLDRNDIYSAAVNNPSQEGGTSLKSALVDMGKLALGMAVLGGVSKIAGRSVIEHWSSIRDQWRTYATVVKTASKRLSECSRLVQAGEVLQSRLERKEALETLRDKILQEQGRLEQAEAGLKKTTKQINKLTKGICPTCGKVLKNVD